MCRDRITGGASEMWGRSPHFFVFGNYPRFNMNEALEDVIREAVDRLGFDLVEVRKGGTGKRPLVEVRIDRRDGSGVSVDDCAVASRAIEPLMDESGLVGRNYVLEVSSPGVERPLRNAADWRRFAGRWARVLAPSWGGRREVEVLGIDDSAGVDLAVVRERGGAEHRLPLSDVKEARLVFRWERQGKGNDRIG